MPSKNSKQAGEFSGQFRLRLPRDLHGALSQEAERQGISLNSYIIYLLGTRHSQDEFLATAGRLGTRPDGGDRARNA